jgi:hypothetical protein
MNASRYSELISSLVAAGYRQRRVEMLVNKSTISRISSFLTKSYVDGAGKDFGDVSIQA